MQPDPANISRRKRTVEEENENLNPDYKKVKTSEETEMEKKSQFLSAHSEPSLWSEWVQQELPAGCRG